MPDSPKVLGRQGCGNTMLDLSDLVPFHQGQVRNFHLIFLPDKYKINTILHFKS